MDAWKQLTNGSNYLNYCIWNKWRNESFDLYKDLNYYFKFIRDKSFDEDYLKSEKLKNFRKKYKNPLYFANEYNEKFIIDDLSKNEEYFNDLEGKNMNESQRRAIVIDENHHLLIAGAGSGKTTTIVSKVAYLIEKKGVDPNDIILTTFTNDAASELQKRVKNIVDLNVKAKTIHSFGREIIAHAENRKPSLAFDPKNPKKLNSFMKKVIDQLLQNNQFISDYITFYTYFYKHVESVDSKQNKFESLDEYHEYVRSMELKTFNGDIVKSFEELVIANFLFTYNIAYEYEKEYEFDTASIEFSQYEPDFYISKYRVYLEHFGIDRKGNVPKHWKSGSDGRTAKEKYNEGIQWKRELHQEKGTTLVETFSYERAEGVLLKSLKDKLINIGVKFNNKKTNKELLEAVNKKFDEDEYSPYEFLSNFINLVKSNQFTIGDLQEIAEKSSNKFRLIAFLKMFEPVFNKYQEHLNKLKKVDFGDMIAKAKKYVDENKYVSPYKYFIVDEYQDTSLGQLKFIQSIIKQKNHNRLFAVGDDWQSIYRFRCADIGVIYNFKNNFIFSKVSNLNITYRFNRLIEYLTSSFIQKNPKQTQRKIHTVKKVDIFPLEIIIFDDLNQESELDNIIKKILKAENNQDNAEILILARYNEPYEEYFRAFKRKYPKLKLKFKTVHGAKGTEADYLIIHDVIAGKKGVRKTFPSRMKDDPILDLVRSFSDDFLDAEERRLFYVAMTRAKKKIFITTRKNEPKKDKSYFIEEIEKEHFITKDCPSCSKNNDSAEESPKLIIKNNKEGLYLGCLDFPECRYVEKLNLESLWKN